MAYVRRQHVPIVSTLPYYMFLTSVEPPCSYSSSSFGWNAPQKQEELYHRQSRFILAQEGGYTTHETEYDHVRIAAYVMFRFEREGSENVVYW